MKITFDQLILYNITDFYNKKVSFTFKLLTNNGIETFSSPVYKILDNMTFLNFY